MQHTQRNFLHFCTLFVYFDTFLRSYGYKIGCKSFSSLFLPYDLLKFLKI